MVLIFSQFLVRPDLGVQIIGLNCFQAIRKGTKLRTNRPLSLRKFEHWRLVRSFLSVKSSSYLNHLPVFLLEMDIHKGCRKFASLNNS